MISRLSRPMKMCRQALYALTGILALTRGAAGSQDLDDHLPNEINEWQFEACALKDNSSNKHENGELKVEAGEHSNFLIKKTKGGNYECTIKNPENGLLHLDKATITGIERIEISDDDLRQSFKPQKELEKYRTCYKITLSKKNWLHWLKVWKWFAGTAGACDRFIFPKVSSQIMADCAVSEPEAKKVLECMKFLYNYFHKGEWKSEWDEPEKPKWKSEWEQLPNEMSGIVIGEPKTGKSSLLDRLRFHVNPRDNEVQWNQKFEKQITTYHHELPLNLLDNHTTTLKCADWTLGTGDESYRAMIPIFIKPGCSLVVFTYSILDQQTYDSDTIRDYLDKLFEVRDKFSGNMQFLLIGNKSDKSSQVSVLDVMEKADDRFRGELEKMHGQFPVSHYLCSAFNDTAREYDCENVGLHTYERSIQEMFMMVSRKCLGIPEPRKSLADRLSLASSSVSVEL